MEKFNIVGAHILRSLVFAYVKLVYRVKYVNIAMSRFKGPAILYANHKSAIDPFLIGAVYKPFVHWIAKDQIFKFKVFNGVLRGIGAVPIRRGKNDAEAVKRIFEIIRNDGIVCIFPEGTRIRKPIDDREEIKISRSPILIAWKTGAPIIPIAIKGDYRPFRGMTVIFGEPVYIQPKESGGEYTSDELRAISRKLMYRIYDAADAKEDVEFL